MKFRMMLMLLALFALAACSVFESDDAVEEEAPVAAVDPTVVLPTRTAEPPTAMPEPTAEPTSEPVAESEPAESQTEAEVAPAESESAESESTTSAATQSTSNKPTFGDAPFPASSPQEAYGIRANDHAKGASAPDVLIIEYGDFQ